MFSQRVYVIKNMLLSHLDTSLEFKMAVEETNRAPGHIKFTLGEAKLHYYLVLLSK